MGYPRRACAEALKQSNNRLEEAGEMLLTNLDTLITASRPMKADRDEDHAEETELMEDASHIPQLIALGAELEEARALLQIHGNRLDRAAEELLQQSKTSVTTETEQNPREDLLERARAVAEERGKKNEYRSRLIDSYFSLAAKRARLEEQRAADEHRRTTLQTIVPDLLRNSEEMDESDENNPTDQEGSTNYLDLLLDEEETFIREYRQRLVDDGMW